MESLTIKEEKSSFNSKHLQKLTFILNKRTEKSNNKYLIKNKIKKEFLFSKLLINYKMFPGALPLYIANINYSISFSDSFIEIR